MKKYFSIFCFIFLFTIVFSLSVNAQVKDNSDGLGGTVKDNSAGLSCGPGVTCINNPLSVNTPQALIGKIINAGLGVVGSIALLMFVFGGLTLMTSSGSQEKIKKGRDIIVWSAIGLAVIFFSYGLVRILLTTVK